MKIKYINAQVLLETFLDYMKNNSFTNEVETEFKTALENGGNVELALLLKILRGKFAQVPYVAMIYDNGKLATELNYLNPLTQLYYNYFNYYQETKEIYRGKLRASDKIIPILEEFKNIEKYNNVATLIGQTIGLASEDKRTSSSYATPSGKEPDKSATHDDYIRGVDIDNVEIGDKKTNRNDTTTSKHTAEKIDLGKVYEIYNLLPNVYKSVYNEWVESFINEFFTPRLENHEVYDDLETLYLNSPAPKVGDSVAVIQDLNDKINNSIEISKETQGKINIVKQELADSIVKHIADINSLRNEYIDAIKKSLDDLLDGVGEEYDTLKEIAEYIKTDKDFGKSILQQIASLRRSKFDNTIGNLLLKEVEMLKDKKLDRPDRPENFFGWKLVNTKEIPIPRSDLILSFKGEDRKIFNNRDVFCIEFLLDNGRGELNTAFFTFSFNDNPFQNCCLQYPSDGYFCTHLLELTIFDDYFDISFKGLKQENYKGAFYLPDARGPICAVRRVWKLSPLI